MNKRVLLAVLAMVFLGGAIYFYSQSNAGNDSANVEMPTLNTPSTGAVTQPQTKSTTPFDISDVVITLERSQCYGSCPAYKLSIYGDGRVVYQGQSHVRVKGMQTAQISADRVRELVQAFDAAGFYSMDAEYHPPTTDRPAYTTAIALAGKVTKVVNAGGYPKQAPKALTALENKIDEIAESSRWVQ